MAGSTIITTAGNIQRGMQFERGMRMGGFHPILMLLGFLFFVLFIIFIVKMIVIARSGYGFGFGCGMRHHMHQMNEGSPEKMRNPWIHEKSDEALEILRKRFASGEINKEEFEEKEKILKG